LQQIARQTNQSTGNDETENARRQMSRILDHSRQAAEGQVTTIPVTPIVYPNVVPGTSQFVPIGAAMMQPQIFVDALSMVQARATFNINAAPWIMLQPQLQHNSPPSPKRARVQRNWRKLCRFVDGQSRITTDSLEDIRTMITVYFPFAASATDAK
jgi:hypothetical protein